MSEIVLVAAVARNGVVGRAGALPWHLPEDLSHFRAATKGLPVVMGRKTWDSLPARFRPLPGRRNIVVTRQADWQAEGAEPAASLGAALALAADAPRVCVIGGAELYAAALPRADELLLTEIDRDFEGDAHFPAFDREVFAIARRETQRAVAPNDFDLAFVSYRRKTTG